MMRRGDVYLADLSPVQGSEQGELDLWLSYRMILEINIVLP